MEVVREGKVLELEDRWVSARVLRLLEEVGAGELVDEEEGEMPRPCKMRRVRGKPNSSYFKPAGIRVSELEEVFLSLAEFEAIRLIDLDGVSQVDAGVKMKVSQSTLSRILSSARGKVAEGIVNGKAIRIEMGKAK